MSALLLVEEVPFCVKHLRMESQLWGLTVTDGSTQEEVAAGVE